MALPAEGPSRPCSLSLEHLRSDLQDSEGLQVLVACNAHVFCVCFASATGVCSKKDTVFASMELKARPGGWWVCIIVDTLVSRT